MRNESMDNEYGAATIRVLPGLEAIRQHPSMYIGSTGIEGVHRLIFELVDNAVDEAMAGHCARIDVRLEDGGWFEVEDDGRGIPVDIHPSEGVPGCEVALTRLHAGGKFSKGPYALTTGLHGLGLSCVNALSSELQLDIFRDGRHHAQRYSRGLPSSSLHDLGSTERRGTRIRFRPDPFVFGDAVAPSYEKLAARLEQLAFLNAGLSISLNEASRPPRLFRYESGIRGYVDELTSGRSRVHERALEFQGRTDDMEVAVAMQWTTDWNEHVHTFVNGVHTVDGGTHELALRHAVGEAVQAYAIEMGLVASDGLERMTLLDVMEGLTCVLSLRMRSPTFDGQTKTRLTADRVEPFIRGLVARELGKALRADSNLALQVVDRALDATRARIAARNAGQRARFQAIATGFSAPVYQKQFGIRSRNWHESATWITNADLLQKHAAMLSLGSESKLLDVCCGSGVVGSAFTGKVQRRVGLDITPEMVQKARERLDEVHQGSVYAIPFADGTFDAVVTREVLHILPQPEKPVAQIYRVLRSGGQFISGHIMPFGHADAAWMFRVFKKKQPLICNMFQEEDYSRLLLEAGFVDLQMSEYTLWESIDLWIDSWETTALHRHEIRDLFRNAPREARAIHPFEISPSGEIRDCWRWCIFSARKP
jgi:DNA gyrase subunit B